MATATTSNSFGARADLTVGGRSYQVCRLDALPNTGRLPYSLKVLLENMLRNEDGITVTPADI
jgi:aconitate hydratase